MHDNIVRNSSKKFPDWMKTHEVFDKVKINKIFPKIGLTNFKAICEITNSNDAKKAAQQLGNKIKTELDLLMEQLQLSIERGFWLEGKRDVENSTKLQSTHKLIELVNASLAYGDFVKVIENKVSLRLRENIVLPPEETPVFKKDESILKVVGKLFDRIEGLDLKVTKLDQLPEFKEFSKANVPCRPYTMIFSSSNENGLWDIATISMRGIASCQSWTAPQSMGLIGTLVSKFAGVIYIASDDCYIPEYGSKMLYRCVVRMVINRTTKKPFLLLDTMYPNYNADISEAFKKELRSKSGLDILQINDSVPSRWLPLEKSSVYLKQSELSYMDFKIAPEQAPTLIRKVSISVSSLVDKLTTEITNEIDSKVLANKSAYANESKTLTWLLVDYDTKKKAWEENPQEEFKLEKPKMDKSLHSFGKGGVMNFFAHCDKKHGVNSAAKLFIKPILNSITVEGSCSTPQEYHRKYLVSFIKNQKTIKENALKTIKAGTWMRSFPNSSIRFFDFIFDQVKQQLLARTKNSNPPQGQVK